MQIRRARAGDVAAIQAVGQSTWPATYEFAGEEFIADGLARWWSGEAVVRSLETTTCLVAEDGDELVGIGNIDLRGDVPIIWRLHVLPAAQRLGVGSALLAGLVEQVPPGTPAVRLEYLDGNERAARFYAAHRFAELRREPGERPDWPETVWVERSGRDATPGERPN